jgi:hypothetical protein
MGQSVSFTAALLVSGILTGAGIVLLWSAFKLLSSPTGAYVRAASLSATPDQTLRGQAIDIPREDRVAMARGMAIINSKDGRRLKGQSKVADEVIDALYDHR